MIKTVSITERNTNLNIYFNEIRTNKGLTPESERELFARVAAGDRTAEAEIFNAMAKIAVSVAKEFCKSAYLLEDTIQEANLGVLDAIRRFDITKGFRFSSFARWWIISYVTRSLELASVVRVKSPRIMNLVRKIRNEFFKTYDREPSEYEVLDILNEMGEKVDDLQSIQQMTIASIDEPVSGEDGDAATKGETGAMAISMTSTNSVEASIESEALDAKMRRLMSRLNDREKKFVMMAYGLGGYPEMSYDVIAEREEAELRCKNPGKDVHFSSERVRQIVVGAIKKMK